jgi:hypothetical protein
VRQDIEISVRVLRRIVVMPKVMVERTSQMQALRLAALAHDGNWRGKYIEGMNWLDLVSYFFGGVFLGNAVPHFVSGTMGRPFQTPFAKPPGKGLSSSTVNVGWGVFNAAVGYVLVFRVGSFDLKSTVDVAVSGLGVLLISLIAARNFGQLHGGDLRDRE